MVGQGTRIDLPSGKLMFRVYDYTDATRLFGEKFGSRFAPSRPARAKVPARLVGEAPTLEDFRARWINPPERRVLMGRLPDAGRAPLLVQKLDEMTSYDLYDVLAELGYGLAPRTRPERAEAFTYKHERWLATLPAPATATLKALAGQFARSGTDGLESPQVFETPEVMRVGGLSALKTFGQPADILRQTKERLFAA